MTGWIINKRKELRKIVRGYVTGRPGCLVITDMFVELVLIPQHMAIGTHQRCRRILRKLHQLVLARQYSWPNLSVHNQLRLPNKYYY